MNIIKSVLAGALDLIYPPHCIACNSAAARWLCSTCMLQIVYINPPLCARCGIPSAQVLCRDCVGRSYHFVSANSAVQFTYPIVEAVHKLKYGGHIVVADVLAEIMVDRYLQTRLPGKSDLIIAVPERRSRVAERGFNQAEELAKRLAAAVGVEYKANALQKIRNTSRQVGLPKSMRINNLNGAFQASGRMDMTGRDVLIVDDVMTTGSTLSEAARAVLDAGAKSVRAYTLARST